MESIVIPTTVMWRSGRQTSVSPQPLIRDIWPGLVLRRPSEGLWFFFTQMPSGLFSRHLCRRRRWHRGPHLDASVVYESSLETRASSQRLPRAGFCGGSRGCFLVKLCLGKLRHCWLSQSSFFTPAATSEDSKGPGAGQWDLIPPVGSDGVVGAGQLCCVLCQSLLSPHQRCLHGRLFISSPCGEGGNSTTQQGTDQRRPRGTTSDPASPHMVSGFRK